MSISSLKDVIKALIPKRIVSALARHFDAAGHRRSMHGLKAGIIKYYSEKSVVTAEEQEVIDYLRNNPVTVFPYDFQKKYAKELIAVLWDETNGLPYVMHESKRLYFKRSATEPYIKSLYHGLLLDQDEDSPHLYLDGGFKLSPEDVIADIGAAEGNFSLSNIEKVRRIHLFESDPEWIEALEATFGPWKDKVEIHHKLVSDHDSQGVMSFDEFAKLNPGVNFFKVDIEGGEAKFLEGAKQFLGTQPKLKMAICTYHQQQDEEKFSALLKAYDFEVNASKRFMIFYHDKNIAPPFLRRGLLRAQKNTVNG